MGRIGNTFTQFQTQNGDQPECKYPPCPPLTLLPSPRLSEFVLDHTLIFYAYKCAHTQVFPPLLQLKAMLLFFT